MVSHILTSQSHVTCSSGFVCVLAGHRTAGAGAGAGESGPRASGAGVGEAGLRPHAVAWGQEAGVEESYGPGVDRQDEYQGGEQEEGEDTDLTG